MKLYTYPQAHKILKLNPGAFNAFIAVYKKRFCWKPIKKREKMSAQTVVNRAYIKEADLKDMLYIRQAQGKL